MISKINKIKNLGLVLCDYTWNSHLHKDSPLLDFKRYNLIYGWNGSGKTTFSRLFDAIEKGTLKSAPELEYEIEDSDKNKYKNSESFNQKIRVFNQDFIENNLTIRDGKAKSITLILGDANKETIDQIETDKKQLKEKSDELKKISELLERKIKAKGKTFTEIAKTIYVAITGGAIRTYRKDNAESDFAALANKELLPQTDLEKYAIFVKQSSKPPIDVINPLEIKLSDKENESLDLYIKDLLETTEILLAKTVESQVIERFKLNPDISVWVETGLNIHENHKSINCEFCGTILPKDRLLQLSKFFSEEDKQLKQDIENLLSQFTQVEIIFQNLVLPDKARFYEELEKDYKSTCAELLIEKSNLRSSIKEVEQIIIDKKLKTTEPITLNEKFTSEKFTELLRKISDIISAHNQKTLDFEKEKNIAIQKLKNHYLSTIYDEVKAVENSMNESDSSIKKLMVGEENNLGIQGLKKRIVENQAKISSTHKACEDINKGLVTFLGRDELIFEPHRIVVVGEDKQKKEIDDGYVIKRSGKLAENLSEGEKMAIAFVYFTIHLKDQDFDIDKGIVVIDDPISSLDSNSLFQAFAFLKNAVKDAEQIFILTHNFEFLKLLLNWVKNIDRGKKSEFYMLKNIYKEGIRCAYLDKMDKELSDYESEYHYLFKKLCEFKSDGTIGQSYPIPNIARKVLESFLLFRVPSGDGMYVKLEKLKAATKFDENKATAIYKFTNDQSHTTGSGFDPALVPETQKNVKYLLEMIETVFPEHYKILQDSIK